VTEPRGICEYVWAVGQRLVRGSDKQVFCRRYFFFVASSEERRLPGLLKHDQAFKVDNGLFCLRMCV
jgi:hypothetical protein